MRSRRWRACEPDVRGGAARRRARESGSFRRRFVRADRAARPVPRPRPAAPAVLRRSPRAHLALARREHAGHAEPPGRRVPLRARRAHRRAAVRSRRQTPARDEARAAARLRGRDRSRGAARRGVHLQLAWARRLRLVDLSHLSRLSARRVLRHELPRVARRRGRAADALRLLRRGRRALPHLRARTVDGDPRRSRGRLRSQRRVPLHDAGRLRMDRRGRARERPAPQRAAPERGRAGAAFELHRHPGARTPLAQAPRDLHRRGDRLRRAGHPAQLEPLGRAHVRHRARGWLADDRRRGAPCHRPRAGRRDHAAQGLVRVHARRGHRR